MKLMLSGTKIPTEQVDDLCLIATFELYGVINEGIDKYNEFNTVQGFINDMVGNTNLPNMVGSGNKATAEKKLGENQIYGCT